LSFMEGGGSVNCTDKEVYGKQEGHLLSLFSEGSKKDLTRFSDIIAEKFNLPIKFESFIEVFKFLKRFEGLVVAIDEFPYLIESDRTVVS